MFWLEANLDHGLIVFVIFGQGPNLVVAPSPATLIWRGPAWELVFKQPSLKKSCNEILEGGPERKFLLNNHLWKNPAKTCSCAMQSKKRTKSTKLEPADYQLLCHDGTQRLTSSYNLFIFTKPGKVGLWGRRRSSHQCQWSKEPLHSSSPLEEFSPKIKIVFFCRKNRPFLNLDGELGEGWRNVAGPEPSRVPAQSTHQILMWDQIWGWDAVKIRDNYIW